jgi:hypothetical protein
LPAILGCRWTAAVLRVSADNPGLNRSCASVGRRIDLRDSLIAGNVSVFGCDFAPRNA